MSNHTNKTIRVCSHSATRSIYSLLLPPIYYKIVQLHTVVVFALELAWLTFRPLLVALLYLADLQNVATTSLTTDYTEKRVITVGTANPDLNWKRTPGSQNSIIISIYANYQ